MRVASVSMGFLNFFLGASFQISMHAQRAPYPLFFLFVCM